HPACHGDGRHGRLDGFRAGRAGHRRVVFVKSGKENMESMNVEKLKAVVFDWAGTVVDFGSFAPMGVFVEAFRQFGVDVTIAQAREPMGRPKWDHIDAMLKN